MSTSILVAYYPLFLAVAGTILNCLTLIILCRSLFKDTKKQPVICYMRAIAIFDILMLYDWNLDHFLSSVYDYTFESYSITSCKVSLFLGYFTSQSTAWLRVLVCLDRYLSSSRLHKTWLGHPKHIIIVLSCTIVFLALFNLHLLIFACFYTSDGVIDINSQLYEIFPMWDYINLGVYNCVPFLAMLILNAGTIYHLIHLRNTTTIRNSRIQHRSISITLLTTTFLFLITTLPAGIAFGFFQTIASSAVLNSLDAVLFTYHAASLPLYVITFKEFRAEFIAIITCGKKPVRIAPLVTGTLTVRKPPAHQQTHGNI